MCPVCAPSNSTLTASPGLCPTAQQMFVRSRANRQVVRGRAWRGGQARPRGLEPFKFARPLEIFWIIEPTWEQGEKDCPPFSCKRSLSRALSWRRVRPPCVSPRVLGGTEGVCSACHSLRELSSAPSEARRLPFLLSACFVPVAFRSLPNLPCDLPCLSPSRRPAPGPGRNHHQTGNMIFPQSLRY